MLLHDQCVVLSCKNKKTLINNVWHFIVKLVKTNKVIQIQCVSFDDKSCELILQTVLVLETLCYASVLKNKLLHEQSMYIEIIIRG